MKFINWLNTQDKPKEVKAQLQKVLGRSESAVTSYLYGYRKVPQDIASKISDFTKGEVSSVDLDTQYKSFHLNDSFVLAPSKGQRVGKPILSITKHPSQTDFEEFITGIKQLLEVKA